MKNNAKKLIIAAGLVTFCSFLNAQKQRIDSLVIKNGSQGVNKVLISDANGNATWGSAISNTNDSTTASNGLTLSGKDVSLGGALTAASTITTTAANTLALAGLQSGAATDSILVANPTTGVIARKSASTLPVSNIYSADGTVAANRTINLDGKTISFANSTGTAVANQFSVAGSTFSVNALNNRVGINTAAPGGIFSTASLDVRNTTSSTNDAFLNIKNQGADLTKNTFLLLDNTAMTGGKNWFLNSTGSSSIGGAGNLQFTVTGSGPVATFSGSSAYVGIGSTTPSSRLHIYGNGTSSWTNSGITITNAGASGRSYSISSRVSGLNIGDETAGVVRMLIDTTGNVGIVGTLSVSGVGTSTMFANNRALFMQGNNTASGGIFVVRTNNATTGTGNSFLAFENSAGTTIGTISMATAVSVAYNTTSDIRLKEDIKATSYSIDDLMKVKVKDYYYKSDKNHVLQTGFLAQELYKVYPNAVTVGGDDVTKNPWGVDYGKLTPLLVKAIQDQQKQIEVLKAELEQLKTKK